MKKKLSILILSLSFLLLSFPVKAAEKEAFIETNEVYEETSDTFNPIISKKTNVSIKYKDETSTVDVEDVKVTVKNIDTDVTKIYTSSVKDDFLKIKSNNKHSGFVILNFDPEKESGIINVNLEVVNKNGNKLEKDYTFLVTRIDTAIKSVEGDNIFTSGSKGSILIKSDIMPEKIEVKFPEELDASSVMENETRLSSVFKNRKDIEYNFTMPFDIGEGKKEIIVNIYKYNKDMDKTYIIVQKIPFYSATTLTKELYEDKDTHSSDLTFEFRTDILDN